MRRRDLLIGLALIAGAPALAKPGKAPSPDVGVALVPMRMGLDALRIARSWCQAGLDLEAEAAMLDLGKAAKRFEADSARFRSLAPKLGQQDAVWSFEQYWRVFRAAFVMKPEASGARRVLNVSDDLFNTGRKSSAALAQRFGAGPAVRAAEGSALVERMQRLAFSRQWGVGAADVPLQIDAERKAFSQLLTELAAQLSTSPTLSSDVQLAQQQWGFLDRALANSGEPNAARNIMRLGRRMNEAMETLLGHLSS
ncbi:MAG: hypothetical protein FWD62_01565 [Betaproteobacteria bacterium]|nr:hypothetical protein [Betaproteobacteria bacterium]